MTSTASASTVLRLQPATLPPGPDGPSRPQLRVLEGGRAPARLARQVVYRRRRLVAVVLVAALLAVATLLAQAAAAALLQQPAPQTAPGVPAEAPATVVVQPGDTLWSLAAEIAPDTDPRITVDRLVGLNGGAPLVPGQVLELPAS